MLNELKWLGLCENELIILTHLAFRRVRPLLYMTNGLKKHSL